MSRNLVLVESPAKAKTINKYLGKNFIVEATIGHIKNLPKSKLGVDLKNNYEPQFVTIRGKGEIIKKIKSLAGKSKNIYIATDPDREGEAIAQDIAEVISGNGNGKNNVSIHRVLFNEITKSGVEKAMKHPRSIDGGLVTSQRARRVMDRIIGYKISPFLWKAVIDSAGDSLSAGRVQSVALKLICDREELIRKFMPVEYWSIVALFQTDKKDEFKAKLFSIEGKEIRVAPKADISDNERRQFLEKYYLISSETDAHAIAERIKGKKHFEISAIVKRHTRRNPPAPFITSTLQAEASKNLRMRPKQTMMIAQKLYEGIELGKEGSAGLITYMRTDSTRVSEEMISVARNYIKDNYGDKYLPETPNIFNKKGSNVQDAHEAIRPTSLDYTPEFIKQFVDHKTFKLYELIWRRFIASQMNPALLETTIIEVKSDEFLFKAFGTAVQFNGYLQVYQEIEDQVKNAEDKDEYRNETIPLGLEKGDNLNLNSLGTNQHFTKPPARFTESTLIKELESRGIGRPSTYSLIVSTIQDRKYVLQEDRRLVPTERGKEVNRILVENFPDIINESFTAEMEAELDQIAQGENDYNNVLNDFYLPFSKSLKQVENKIEKIYCEICGSEMIIKFGRYGKFLACSNYPDCKNIKSLKDLAQQQQEPEYTGEKCEKCGSRTVYRTGKFGRFIGCERYPDCDFVKNISLGVVCPKCSTGEIVERKSRRNRIFYGCSRYPDCDFVSWYKPVLQECPNKDSHYMEQRYSTRKGEYLRCPKCSEELVPEENREAE